MPKNVRVRQKMSITDARRCICPITRKGGAKGARCLADRCALWVSDFLKKPVVHGVPSRFFVPYGHCSL